MTAIFSQFCITQMEFIKKRQENEKKTKQRFAKDKCTD